MTERFMVDDAGTLIDMTNRNTYDYVSDVCGLLNELHEEYEELKLSNINLEAKLIHLLDILQEKGSMTYEEVHEWWNSEVMMND